MQIVPLQTVTAAIPAGTVQNEVDFTASPFKLTVQFNFVYGSGGTSLDVYLQTTLDDGVTWSDIANFHATTASLRKIVNLSGLTPETTQITPTNGAMTANTAQDGVLGPKFRALLQSVGTYGGDTTIRVDVHADKK